MPYFNAHAARSMFTSMSIFADVLSFIHRPQPSEFEELALRVFRFQAETVAAYRAYLDSLTVDPRDVKEIAQIPPVSTLAFKYASLETTAAPRSPESRLFLTSGTSIGRDQRGRHLVLRPEIYRASALGHLRAMLFPDDCRMAMLALHPTADRLPESSLSQMISWCFEEFGSSARCCAATRDRIDLSPAIDFLRHREQADEPVCIVGTTAACASLFAALEDLSRPLRLDHRSRLMDTGGAKGQVTPLAATEVIERAVRLLDLDPEKVINEYGMTELCSQLYDATGFNTTDRRPAATRVKLAPAWMRPFTFDPATLRPLPAGQRGLLGFFDLANAASVSMIVTEDLGAVDSQGGVRIEGRSSSAGARGCALAIKQFADREPTLSDGVGR
jgi:Acyl-protein synthetase, LuxE